MFAVFRGEHSLLHHFTCCCLSCCCVSHVHFFLLLVSRYALALDAADYIKPETKAMLDKVCFHLQRAWWGFAACVFAFGFHVCLLPSVLQASDATNSCLCCTFPFPFVLPFFLALSLYFNCAAAPAVSCGQAFKDGVAQFRLVSAAAASAGDVVPWRVLVDVISTKQEDTAKNTTSIRTNPSNNNSSNNNSNSGFDATDAGTSALSDREREERMQTHV